MMENGLPGVSPKVPWERVRPIFMSGNRARNALAQRCTASHSPSSDHNSSGLNFRSQVKRGNETTTCRFHRDIQHIIPFYAKAFENESENRTDTQKVCARII